MAHNINTYIGRKAAWHELGTVTGEYQTWEQILAHGGLDYDVFKSQLHDGLGRPVAAWATFRWDLVDKETGNSSAAQFLGTVGEDYKVIPHKSGFELIDAMMGSTNGAHYETAGVLGNGEVVWGLADLGLRVRVGDDVTKNYLLFTTSHDGSYSYQVRDCFTRVVCNNTLNVALGEKTANLFRVRHTKNALARVEDAHKALLAVQHEVKSIENTFNMLATRKVTKESLDSIMLRLFPAKKDESGEIESSTRRDNMLTEVLGLYESNDNNAFPEQRGTAYNLLNAVVEYTDHYRSTKSDMRSQSAMFGSGDKLKTLAFQTIANAAREMPTKPQPLTLGTSDWSELGIEIETLKATN